MAGEDRTRSIIGVAAGVTALMVVLGSGRIFVRWKVKDRMRLDDWIMLVAMILGVVMSILESVQTTVGLGHRSSDMHPGWQSPYAKYTIATTAFTFSTMSLTKVSICLGYLRLFPSQANRTFINVLVAYIASCGFALTIALTFHCIPLRSIWDPSLSGKCINSRVAWLVAGALNSLSDFVVYLWPAIPWRKMHLSFGKKLELSIIILIGVLVCAAGICRTIYLDASIKATDSDSHWTAAPVSILTTIQIHLSLICGCLPTIQPLLAHFFPSWFNTPTSVSYASRPRSRASSFIGSHFRFKSMDKDNSSPWPSIDIMTNDEQLAVIEAQRGKCSTIAWSDRSQLLRQGGRSASARLSGSPLPMEGIVMHKDVIVDSEARSIAEERTGTNGNESEEWIIQPDNGASGARAEHNAY